MEISQMWPQTLQVKMTGTPDTQKQFCNQKLWSRPSVYKILIMKPFKFFGSQHQTIQGDFLTETKTFFTINP